MVQKDQVATVPPERCLELFSFEIVRALSLLYVKIDELSGLIDDSPRKIT
jgi:hypothetical protein